MSEATKTPAIIEISGNYVKDLNQAIAHLIFIKIAGKTPSPCGWG